MHLERQLAVRCIANYTSVVNVGHFNFDAAQPRSEKIVKSREYNKKMNPKIAIRSGIKM